MQLAMRGWRIPAKGRGLLKAIAFGAVLGVMGPFGSQTAFTTAVKYSFWMVVTLAGFGAAGVAQHAISLTWPGRRTAAKVIAIALASGLPMTFFVAWAFTIVQQGRTFGPVQLLTLFPFVSLVQLLIAMVISPTATDETREPEIATEAPASFPADFLARLPANMRTDIIALEAEDHYLRVHTLHGSAMVLMRLADAAALIDERIGMRVHRSWWVAKDGVRTIEKSKGRCIARLVNDMEAPISRTYLPAARIFFSDKQ